jgi:hypothetical protein
MQGLALVPSALHREVAAGFDARGCWNTADDAAGATECGGQGQPRGSAPATTLSVPLALWLVTTWP